jgi:hypothetical protein
MYQVRIKDVNGLHRGKSSQQVYSAIIIAGTRVNSLCKKKDGGLRHCVDYRVLNLVTVKNWYPLPVISEMPDSVCEARICMKLDLRGTYNFIPIKDGHECEKAFRMH